MVGRHFGGSSSFGFDITGYVGDGLEHHLVVRASSDLRSMMQSAGKQSLLLNSHGCQYTRTTGIWQTVWLEAVASAGLQSVHALTDIDQKQLVIHPRFYRDSYKNTLRIVLQENSKKIGTVCVKAANSSVAVFSLKNVRLWSPESPFLYDVLYQVLDDQIGCPTWTVELANGILKLLNKPYGTYHVCGSGYTSWYGFAKEIFKQMNLNVNLQPCTTDEFPRPAKRPAYSVMDNDKICRQWEAALKDYLDLRIEA